MKIRLNSYVPRMSIFRFVEMIPVRIFKPYLPKCCDCVHANLYVPHFAYPYTNPKCAVHHKEISDKQIICNDFELIGRNSR